MVLQGFPIDKLEQVFYIYRQTPFRIWFQNGVIP